MYHLKNNYKNNYKTLHYSTSLKLNWSDARFTDQWQFDIFASLMSILYAFIPRIQKGSSVNATRMDN